MRAWLRGTEALAVMLAVPIGFWCLCVLWIRYDWWPL